MKLYLLALLATAGAHAHNCGSSPTDILLVTTDNDAQNLVNCTTINGSLQINGQYLLTSIGALTNLEQITGYLNIYHSPGLHNLSALSNLESIDGEVLYFDQYSVFISGNQDLVDPLSGLCWADAVNWTMYTSNNTDILVQSNALDCAPCFAQCHGSWVGADPQHCQFCANFLTGDNCVSHCPIGTDIDNVTKFCNETTVPFIDTSCIWRQ